MTKKNLAIIASSSLGLFLVAALTVGVVYKWNKTKEYNEYLELQAQQVEQHPKTPVEVKPVKPINVPPIKPQSKLEPAESVPQVIVSTDESGNQTITPEWTKPEPPTEEELHNPDVKPDTPKPETPAKTENTNKPDKKSDDGVKYDDNGNQIPNEKGEVYVPGFGWIADSGPNKNTTIDNTGWEDSPQVGF